jgi:hypothetical protein
MVPARSCDFLEDSSLLRYQKVLFNLINGKQMGTMRILQEFIAPQNWHSQHLPTRRGCGRDEFAQRDLRQGRGGPVGRNGQVLLIIGIFIYLYWIWCNSPKEPWPGPKKKCSCLFIQLGPGDLPHAHSLFLPCTSNWDLFGKSRVRDLLVPTPKNVKDGNHRQTQNKQNRFNHRPAEDSTCYSHVFILCIFT